MPDADTLDSLNISLRNEFQFHITQLIKELDHNPSDKMRYQELEALVMLLYLIAETTQPIKECVQKVTDQYLKNETGFFESLGKRFFPNYMSEKSATNQFLNKLAELPENQLPRI